MEAEEATVRAFVARNRQERWLSGLASQKRRQETVDRLHDSSDLREDLLQPLAGDPEKVASELGRRGAPAVCHVIGGPQDGEEHDLLQALEAAQAAYGGVLMSCVPGRLGVYLAEAPADFACSPWSGNGT